jgi:outer membrane lipoprotein-sorting protein
MIVLRFVAVCVVLLVIVGCRSQTDTRTNATASPDTTVSSTPPFQTKEPEHYRAVRTITAVNAEGQTLVTRTSVARDGELRRHESTSVAKTIVYLDVPDGKFVLLPVEKVYADVTDQSQISADPNEEGLASSPDARLHADAGSTSYQKLGNEVIAGRNTNKYRIVVNSSPPANVSQFETLMWIDEALQMPIRSETKSADGYHVTMEISEIELEVDKSQFAIPRDYKKVTFTELRKRLIAPAQPEDE